jgi:hypothetical protein
LDRLACTLVSGNSSAARRSRTGRGSAWNIFVPGEDVGHRSLFVIARDREYRKFLGIDPGAGLCLIRGLIRARIIATQACESERHARVRNVRAIPWTTLKVMREDRFHLRLCFRMLRGVVETRPSKSRHYSRLSGTSSA